MVEIGVATSRRNREVRHRARRVGVFDGARQQDCARAVGAKVGADFVDAFYLGVPRGLEPSLMFAAGVVAESVSLRLLVGGPKVGD